MDGRVATHRATKNKMQNGVAVHRALSPIVLALLPLATPAQEIGTQRDATARDRERAPDGFSVSARIIGLRTRALNRRGEQRNTAIRALGRSAIDRVSAEILKGLVRTSDSAQRASAAAAIIHMGERLRDLGFSRLAGELGEHIYLSSYAVDLRGRAYALFMLLDTERAARHRGGESGIGSRGERTRERNRPSPGLHKQATVVSARPGAERLAPVSTRVLLLRAAAVAPETSRAVSAIRHLGNATTDAASEELLYAFYRGRCPKRRTAAAHALLSLLAHAERRNDAPRAGRIRNQLVNSTLPEDRALRDRARKVLFSIRPRGESR